MMLFTDNERTVVDYGSTETLKEMGFPDGMTIDTENNIWVACYGGSRIFQFDPNTGMLICTECNYIMSSNPSSIYTVIVK